MEFPVSGINSMCKYMEIYDKTNVKLTDSKEENKTKNKIK